MLTRIKHVLPKIMLLLVSLTISLIIVEIAVRTLTPFPRNRNLNTVHHDRLSYVLDPSMSDVNEDGFRNPVPPADQSVFMIGDSHTYGVNVTWDQAWPYQLGELTGKTVYNFGISGYNILQYRVLFRRALRYQPDAIIVGLYLRNDLTPRLYGELLRMNYWKTEIKQSSDLSFTETKKLLAEKKEQARQSDLGSWTRLKTALKQTGIGGLANFYVWSPIKKKFLLSNDKYYIFPGDGPGLFIHKQRVNSADHLDMTRPVTKESVVNAKTIFREMKRRADRENIRFGVLLIPSKDRVYYHWAKKRGLGIPDEYRESVRHMDVLNDHFSRFFDRENINYADATDPMVDLIDRASRSGLVVYPRDDGHPKQEGYQVYARVARSLIAN